MDVIPYNSRDLYYKSEFGAVKEGTVLKFRLVLPRSFTANGATLCIRRDSEQEFTEHGMLWAGMYGESNEVWDIEFTPETSGLYWYRFNIYSPWGQSTLYNDGNSVGSLPFTARTILHPNGLRAV